MPVLAARGYAVFRPNYRGSTGYGDAFLRDVVGGYFRNMHLDVMAGVDALVQQGLADPDRLAVMGVERRRTPHEQADHVHGPFQGRLVHGRRGNWMSLFAQTRHAIEPGAVVRRHAVAARTRRSTRIWDKSPLKDVAEGEDADAVLRRSGGSAGADAAIGRDVSCGCVATACRRGSTSRRARAISGAELRHQLSKANAELEWFER